MRPKRWFGLAVGAGEAFAARQLLLADEDARHLPAAPAVHQHVSRDGEEPDRLLENGKTDECGGTDEADDGGDLKAPTAPQRKPEQRAQNLPAIEGIDGQDVESEQDYVDQQDGTE